MKHLINAAITAGLLALAVAPAAAQVGVYIGPNGAGVRVYHPHRHWRRRVCRMDYYGYEHCWWR